NTIDPYRDRRYAIGGFLLGMAFLLVASLLEIYLENRPVSLAAFFEVQQSQPLLWIVDLLPVVFGGFGEWFGRKLIRQETNQHALEDELTQRATYLEAARQEAEKSANARSEFLATMSHEIRTPLNAVIGFSGLLGQTKMNAEQREFVDTIHMSGEALLSLINDILDYSKIESGNLDLEHEPFPLAAPVEETLDLLAGKAHQKELELVYDLASDLPPGIIGDITRLRQVLINLVNNAIKFTESGEILIRCKPVSQEGENTVLQFSVQDSGIGIPPSRIGKLFQSFTQVDASTTRKYGGTGLGLAISKRLVNLMGGEIWVESIEGEGSTFFFTIAVPAARLIDVEASPDPTPLRGKRILLVDDHPLNLTILEKWAQLWEMEITKCLHPQEALEQLEKVAPFDMAILDMHMPGMDGLQLAHAIRKQGIASLPLIMLSSVGRAGSPEERAVFSSWLTKPAKKNQLMRTLLRVSRNRVASQSKKVIEGPESLEAAAKHHTRPLKILLAEDNPVNQKVAKRILNKLGYDIAIAGNGQIALEASQKKAFDLILMDMQMPELDGIEATQEIRRLPTGNSPIIIAMTANASEQDRQRCLDAGMNDFLSKPVKWQKLDETIMRWFYAAEGTTDTAASVGSS
ncbi:MAG: response regulator, partial [Bacteroidota bacterium]